MELLYLWINKSANDCILQQEFNFSPLYKFKVDNAEKPRNISYDKAKEGTINLLSNGKGKINNITAIVGSNGAGKTTLLSFIARNDCHYKFDNRDGYERQDIDSYEHDKSIYVFIENNCFIIYYNLEEEITCDFDISPENLYWNRSKEYTVEQLCSVRKHLIVYLSNSSFIPEALLTYSQFDKTYNVNLHQRSMYNIANRFYMALFNLERIKEEDDGFAWIIIKQRNDRTFQELLDIQYYNYLIEHQIKDFIGNFKEEIYVYFEDIITLIRNKYLKEFVNIEATKNRYGKSEQKSDIESNKLSEKYNKKIKSFKRNYDFSDIEQARRKNCTVVLYVNLLFEAFFYEDKFTLPEIDFKKDISQQMKNVYFSDKYKEYLTDIEEIDKVLSVYNMNKNLIDNPDDMACSYDKVVGKDKTDFYKYIGTIFKKRNSFALRYIRIKNLEMSSGERAMQNMFSWLVLIPQLDAIMGIERATYESKLLLIDEIDLYSHPEWQRKSLKQLIKTINKIENETPVQIIVTSHSPLILSDFPRENIIYMNKYKGKTVVDDNKKHKQSFGANIYTLLNDAFFLENGAVGDFAKDKILSVYQQLENDDSLNKMKQNENQQIINMIGDDTIKREMQRLYYKKYNNTHQTIVKETPQNVDELQKLKKQLEDSLRAVNKMLKGD